MFIRYELKGDRIILNVDHIFAVTKTHLLRDSENWYIKMTLNTGEDYHLFTSADPKEVDAVYDAFWNVMISRGHATIDGIGFIEATD